MTLRHILTVCLALAGFAVAKADMPPTAYEYSIRYHLGFIDKTAASATLIVQCDDNGNFFGTLAGRSIDWDGRYFEVTDTLSARMTPCIGQVLPDETVYSCIGWYRKPTVEALRSGCYDPDAPENYVNTAGQGCLDASESTLNNIMTTANLLATFYYGQSVDFDSLNPGQTVEATLSNGTQVSMTYNGTMQWRDNPVRDLTISYSGADVPVRCLIHSETGIPLMFSASLIIGEVEMTLR